MFAKFMSWLVRPIVAHIADDPAYLKLYATKVEDIAKHIDKGHLSEVICDTLDIDEIARKAAENYSPSIIAGYLDSEDIAQHVEVDYYDLAGRMEASEVAAHLDLTDIAREIEVDVDDVTVDYKALAKELIRELGAANKVEVKSSK